MNEQNIRKSAKEEIGEQFSQFIEQLDPNLLLQMLPGKMLLDLSFYNFKNAITACYYADRNLIVRKVNQAFCNYFVDEDVEGQPLLEVFEKIGMAQEDIGSFEGKLQEQGWVKIPQIEVVTGDKSNYFSLFSTYTEYHGMELFSGLQGQFIGRTQEVLLRKRQEAMAGQIRHDMKNRIAASLMGSDALLQEWEMLKANVTMPEETKYFIENLEETLKEINTNSDYLNKLVLQMLDASKLQSGQLSLKKTQFDIKEALNQVIQALRPQQESRQIEVNVEGNSITVDADFVQLSRVLENYHSNALKYTKTKIEWTIKQENNDLLIVVQDDGEGISKEYLQRIFDPFFQVPGKEKEGSTGLGLDSVKDLVLLHQGTTWAESDGPGKGSRFCLKIPITPK